jgi:trans-aconitate methyltransferase
VTSSTTRDHWDHIFVARPESDRSWSQDAPTPSLDRIAAVTTDLAAPIVDVGGGASRLVDHLVSNGHTDVTVLDISSTALHEAATRLGHAPGVQWVASDLLEWQPAREYAVWHDRAVFHFLTDPDHQRRYAELARRAVAPGGQVVLATFAPDGPTACSGLPVQQWSADGLAAHFADGFTLVEHAVLVHRTPGGADQPFTWVTLRRSTARP